MTDSYGSRGAKRARKHSLRFVLRGMTASVILLCTSCAIIQAPPSPEQPVETPEDFSRTGELPVADRWWEMFGDEELNALVEEAISGNYDIRASWDRIDQAAALARQAGAALHPSLSITAGASRTRTERVTTTGAEGTVGIGATSVELGGGEVSSTRDSYSMGLSASYELDVWGRVRASRNAARWNYRATEEDLAAIAMTLSAEVSRAWYGVVQQRAVLKLLQEQLKTNGEFLELVELRFRNGKASAVDVFQQRRQLESTRGEVPRARMQLKVLENRLAVLLGRVPQTRLDAVGDVLPELPAVPATGVPADLVTRRPDLRAAYARLSSADEGVAAATADRFPSIGLSARVEGNAEDVGDVFDNWLASIAGSLVGPILDGGRRGEEVKRARALASERFHGYGAAVLGALEEVEDALVREEMQGEYVDSLAEQIELSRKVVEQSRLRYLQGATDYLPVLESLATLQRLERTGIEARGILVEYRIALYRALGGGWALERTNKRNTDSGDITQ